VAIDRSESADAARANSSRSRLASSLGVYPVLTACPGGRIRLFSRPTRSDPHHQPGGWTMRIVTIALVGVLATVGLATGVQAAGSKCTGAKEKATGKKASCKLSLYSKATSKGEGVDNLK